MNEIKRVKKSFQFPFFRISLYVIILSLINIILAFFISTLSVILIFIILAFIVILAVYTWRQPIGNKTLHLHSIVNIMGGSTIGILVAFFFTKNTIISFLLSFAVMDVVIFSRFGKHTFHRKLFESKVILKRISVCMHIPNDPGLYPIIGVGDMFFYSLIVGATIKIWGIHSIWIACTAVILGQLLNMAYMLLFIKKPWYQGIPATLLPALIFVVFLLM